MKVKALSRNPEDHVRQRANDIHKIQRNYDPALHPFERAREYVRALNAHKLDRLFAKPFVGSLDGHADSVYALAKHPTAISRMVSGSADGEIRVWNLQTQETVWKAKAHRGFVRGLCASPSRFGQIMSIGDDRAIRLWDDKDHDISASAPTPSQNEEKPTEALVCLFLLKTPFAPLAFFGSHLLGNRRLMSKPLILCSFGLLRRHSGTIRRWRRLTTTGKGHGSSQHPARWISGT